MMASNGSGKKSLSDRLALLRSGKLSSREIAEAIADFGSENLVEAKPDVERLLDHKDEIVRYNAIAALAYEWGITSRNKRIVEILLGDPDRDCRRQAAGALGSLFRNTKDRDTSRTLADVVLNEGEERDVRAFAYTAFLDVLAVPRPHQPNAVGMDLASDVDWNLVRQYASASSG